MERKARRQRLAGRLGGAFQLRQMRPRRFRVHVVGGHRGHPAPVVETGVDEAREHPGTQVRRGLNARSRPQDEPGHRDGPQVVFERRLRGRRHRRTGLGPEVLHDHFLNVAVLLFQTADGEQRLDALAAGLADADEDSGGERHRQLARSGEGRKPHLRVLVRRAVVRPALLAQPPGHRFEHDPRRHRDFAQASQLLPGHHPGIDVRQEPGLLVHAARSVHQVIDGGGEARFGEPLARRPVPALGLIAQGEQGLRASGRSPAARDRHRLVHRKVRRPNIARGFREGAVVAYVAAELGEGNEDLGGPGHDIARTAVTHAAGGLHQRVRILEPGERERFRLVEPASVRHGMEHRVIRHGHHNILHLARQTPTREFAPVPLTPFIAERSMRPYLRISLGRPLRNAIPAAG